MADRDTPAGDLHGTPESSGADDRLVEWAQAVADHRAIDWEQLRSTAPELAASIAALRLVETVIAAHQTPGDAPPGVEPVGTGTVDASGAPPRPAFPPLSPDAAWGPLRLIEKIGEGEFGEVFRATDPALGIEVAVKILRRRSRDEAATERFFEEARRLARVRHPNVLRIFGAATHDGRVGIWTELVPGRTLEHCIHADGPFGPREAAVIGIDLCGAIAAVHKAGLLHRDLKTQNVMREQGGRVVLMDFGSVSQAAGAESRSEPGYGTPITVAPELLRGEPATAATDIYALGVLLYRLVCGRYPIEAKTLVELIDRHHRGERASLREARPDIPSRFADVVERALDPDPKYRFAGPGAMERALRASLGVSGSQGAVAEDGSRRLPAWMRFAGIGIAALLTVVVGHTVVHVMDRARAPRSAQHGEGVPGGARGEATAPSSAGEQRPAEAGAANARGAARTDEDLSRSALAATASLYRQRGTMIEPLFQGASVSPGDGLYLTVESAEPMHVYVLDQDDQGHVYVLFPLPGFEPANPLGGGVRHRLPGSRGGHFENWRITSAAGAEDIIVIAARDPLPELEREIERIPRAVPGAPVNYGSLSPQTAERLRGIGGTEPGATATSEGRSPLQISAVLRGLEAGAHDAHDLWVWGIRLQGR